MSLVDLGKRLLEAAKQGCVDEVRTLMSNGAPFTTDWLGTSPLHFAAMHGHVATAEVLLKAGISRDARTKVDRTPLHVAAQEGHSELVELLIRNGADIEAKDMLKMTPLHWAVEKGHINVIELLLASGADADCQNKFEKTCIDIATGNGRQDISEILFLSRGINSGGNSQANVDMTQSAVEQLVEESQEVNEVQPEITIEQDVQDNIISAEAAEGDTYVIDANSNGEEDEQRGYYLTDGSGVAVTEEEEVGGGEEQNTGVLAALATIAEATASRTISSDADALKWLESQGISMMAADNGTLVTNTLDSGQQLALTEAGKLALKQMVQTKREEGEETAILQDGKVLLVDSNGQVVMHGSGDAAETMMVTLGSDGTIIRDEASGEPAYKRIKMEDSENQLIIEQDVEEAQYEDELDLHHQQLTLKTEPE